MCRICPVVAFASIGMRAKGASAVQAISMLILSPHKLAHAASADEQSTSLWHLARVNLKCGSRAITSLTLAAVPKQDVDNGQCALQD